jgi:hypothetical protein
MLERTKMNKGFRMKKQTFVLILIISIALFMAIHINDILEIVIGGLPNENGN